MRHIHWIILVVCISNNIFERWHIPSIHLICWIIICAHDPLSMLNKLLLLNRFACFGSLRYRCRLWKQIWLLLLYNLRLYNFVTWVRSMCWISLGLEINLSICLWSLNLNLATLFYFQIKFSRLWWMILSNC